MALIMNFLGTLNWTAVLGIDKEGFVMAIITLDQYKRQCELLMIICTT